MAGASVIDDTTVSSRAAGRDDRWRSGGSRDLDPERRADPLGGLHSDRSPVRLGDVPHDREPEPGAPATNSVVRGIARSRPVRLVEALEDAGLLGRGNPDPVVRYGEPDTCRAGLPADAHLTAGTAGLDGIVRGVQQRLSEPFGVGADE